MEAGSHRPWGKGRVVIREATVEDCKAFAEEISEETKQELRASTGQDPLPALQYCHSVADEVWVLEKEDDGRIMSLFGVRMEDPDVGGVLSWSMVAECVTQKYKISFGRIIRELLEHFSSKYGLLYGFVDIRNTISVRWLQSLGFTLTGMLRDMGPEKQTFYAFCGSFPREKLAK